MTKLTKGRQQRWYSSHTGKAWILSFSFSQGLSAMPKQVASSSWRCLWTWTQTVTRSSTPISHAPQIQRTSALSSRPSRTPSCSSTSKNTTWCEEKAKKKRAKERVIEWARRRPAVLNTQCRCLLYTHSHMHETWRSEHPASLHTLQDQHYPCCVPAVHSAPQSSLCSFSNIFCDLNICSSTIKHT